MTAQRQRPAYGIDAPGLVKGFFLVGIVACTIAVIAILSPWPGGLVASIAASLAGFVAAYAMGMGCFMLYGSLVGKVRGREYLLDLLPWSGGESVLDVGCGRGLMLVAAARRVPKGRAVGIDLWQAVDQSGNRPEATLANAQVEGVADRIEIQTGDARRLPFADASFDIVVSHWVVHNLYETADRAGAIAEMNRVLKPGGHVLIADIEHHDEYLAKLRQLGFVNIRRDVSTFWDAIRGTVSFGHFRPGAVMGRKPADTEVAPVDVA